MSPGVIPVAVFTYAGRGQIVQKHINNLVKMLNGGVFFFLVTRLLLEIQGAVEETAYSERREHK